MRKLFQKSKYKHKEEIAIQLVVNFCNIVIFFFFVEKNHKKSQYQQRIPQIMSRFLYQALKVSRSSAFLYGSSWLSENAESAIENASFLGSSLANSDSGFLKKMRLNED